MDTQPATQNRSDNSNSASDEMADGASRFVLWLFVLVFIGFGLILLSDLVSGLFR